MEQILLHLIGDYVTQSDWMAQNKTKSTWAALCHATVYSAPFALIASHEALFVIWFTHLLIDRFRVARYVVWVKNQVGMPVWDAGKGANTWERCSKTGYTAATPDWLAVWLLIACDNTIHLCLNYLALKFL